jgi:predicted dehydrogenase
MTTVGMIGAGRWGANWIRTLAALPGAQLRWVCDVSPASLDRIRQQFPQVQTTTRLDDLLQDTSLDSIVIATIAPTHFDVARKALQAGKHVLVEKPMTLTTRDAVELNELARRLHRVLMVGHLLEYHPIIRHIRGMIETGELGEVYGLYRSDLGAVPRPEHCQRQYRRHRLRRARISRRPAGTRPCELA